MPPVTPQDRKRKASKGKGKYAATTWGAGGSVFEDLQVPSGQMCLARRPGVQGLIEAGVLRDIDTLSSIVDQKHIKRVEGRADPEVDVQSLIKDEASLLSILDVVDKVLCYVVVEPEILAVPAEMDDREDGVIYTDMVDIEDKMYIFNFAVGGTRSLETFRQQRDELMGSVDPVEAVAGDAT